MTTTSPGSVVTLSLNFYDQTSGSLTDPTAVQLDITYGNAVGLVADTTGGGPYYYGGSSTPSSTQIYRIGVGQYAIIWLVPTTATPGVYVANWTCTYTGDNFLVEENFAVTGGGPFVPVTSGDVGYWTGSISYPTAGVTIPLGGVDANGTAWLLQKVDGWDSPDTAGQVIQRSGDHGGWPTNQYYQARIITLTLQASAQTQALRDVARAQLQQAVPVNDLATFTYNEPVAKQCEVRRSGRVTESCPTLVDAVFTVPMVAPDPRKYSTTTNSVSVAAASSGSTGITVPFTLPLVLPAQLNTGTVTVTNNGTFETRPTVTISGPIVGPSVTNITQGMTVSYSGLSLTMTDTLVIDFNARQGYLNGAFRAADVYSGWWDLQPGANVLHLGGTSSGSGGMAVAWSDAYI